VIMPDQHGQMLSLVVLLPMLALSSVVLLIHWQHAKREAEEELERLEAQRQRAWRCAQSQIIQDARVLVSALTRGTGSFGLGPPTGR
jgi:cell division protein FtsL